MAKQNQAPKITQTSSSYESNCLKCNPFFYPCSQQAAKYGIEYLNLNTSSQLLFYDLQLMLLNGYLKSSMWNDSIENEVLQKIVLICQPLEKNTIRLKDIYFINSLELKIIYKRTGEYHDILQELKHFGQIIKKQTETNIFQHEHQEKYTLKQLFNSSLQVYKKIIIQKQNSKSSIKEQMCKRCAIEQILMKSFQQSDDCNLVLDINIEKNIYQIFDQYLNLFESISQPIRGNYILNQIFGKSYNYIESQLNFLSNLKKEYFVLFMGKYQEIIQKNTLRESIFEYSIKQILDDVQALDKPFQLQQLIEIFQTEDFISDQQASDDAEAFNFLINTKNKLITQLFPQSQFDTQLSFTKEQLQTIVNEDINKIYQQRSAQLNSVQILNKDNIINCITDSLTTRLTTNLKYIQGQDPINEREIIFSYVELDFFTAILDTYAQQFEQFFNLFDTKDPKIKQNITQECSRLSLLIQLKELNVFEAILKLFESVKQIFDVKLTNQQSLSIDFQGEYPLILCQYFNKKFQIKKDNKKFENFIKELEQQFQPHLKNYLNQIQNFIISQRNLAAEEISEKESRVLFFQIFDEWMPQVKQNVLELFIPYVNLEKIEETQAFKKQILLVERLKQNFKFRYMQLKVLINNNFNQYQSTYRYIEDTIEDANNFKAELLEKFVKQDLFSLEEPQQIQEISQHDQNQLKENISDYFYNRVEIKLNSDFVSIPEKKRQEYQQLLKSLDNFFLPFKCIHSIVYKLIWQKKESEKRKYLLELNAYTQKIQQIIDPKLQMMDKIIGFRLTDSTRADIESDIKQYLIKNKIDLDIYEVTYDVLAQEIIERINIHCQYTYESLKDQIKYKQQQLINQYLNEIFEITQDQCKQILIPQIQLSKVEVDQIQNQIQLLILQQDKYSNLKELENGTFQFFRMQILDIVSQKYEVQIENQLNEQNQIH